jgi:hypothetical protein
VFSAVQPIVLVVVLILDLCTLLAIRAFSASTEVENEDDDDDSGGTYTALSTYRLEEADPLFSSLENRCKVVHYQSSGPRRGKQSGQPYD